MTQPPVEKDNGQPSAVSRIPDPRSRVIYVALFIGSWQWRGALRLELPELIVAEGLQIAGHESHYFTLYTFDISR